MRRTVLHGQQLTLRPIERADLDELYRILTSPQVQRWWSRDTRDELEEWIDEEDVVRWSVWIDERVSGMAQAYEEADHEFRRAGIDLFLDPAVHGRGLGRDAIRAIAGWLFDQGHHRIVIDPAFGNERAIRSYEAVGFRRVGVMRRYWFDHTQRDYVDGLLLDLLAGELR
jgi:aminoglycoside 6'-N-acetyltransferase